MTIGLRGAASSGASASGTSLVLNVPAGVAKGDLMVINAVDDGAHLLATPAGWTALFQQVTGAAGPLYLRTFVRVATATEPASYTLTWGAARILIATLCAYFEAGWSLVLGASGSTATVANNTMNAPSITTGGANSLVVAAYACTANFTFAPAGYTTRYQTTTSTTNCPVFDKVYAAAGATGVVTSSAVGSPDSAGMQLEIKRGQSLGSPALFFGSL